MCILFIHVDPEPKEGGYRVVVAANRDEYFARPSAPLTSIDGTTIIGGLDLEPGKVGGMWLGISTKKQENGEGKKLCFANLLNIPNYNVRNVSGRGFIVRDFLESKQNYCEYVKKLEEEQFCGYNFVAAEISTEGAHIYSHSNKPVVTAVYSGQQTLGFGNSPIFVPYLKVTEGRNRFLDIIEKNLKQNELVDELLKLLQDRTSYLPDTELVRRYPKRYEFLNTIFVRVVPTIYGTRTHSIIVVDYDWNVHFTEHTMEEPIDGDNPKWTVNRVVTKL